MTTPIELPDGSDANSRPLAEALMGLACRVDAALEEIAAAVTESRVPSPSSEDLEHALLVPMALGWPMNTLAAPAAFMVAGLTRGAGVQTVGALIAVLGLGWLVADAAAKRPRLALLPSIGGLVSLLSVYGGASMPTDIYGSYGTVCYVGVAVGVGWLCSRLLWPASAAGLFRVRVPRQLELCLDAV